MQINLLLPHLKSIGSTNERLELPTVAAAP